ncbi:MAG: selenocysteine-specific translation elongation factor [Caldilineales bacterium]|nr:selenocysteine-specific translation elongation factor [Caldilineales bacterium]
MKVIATAGHVDHGKSTLVQALSGIDPDRLSEEKERGMTIDLGFAWLDLPDGEAVGIVDVPGHIDFIKNMLAGVGGIDAALFVVAADEGAMPQTQEHLAILDLLEIPRGVVALTKTDLVDDPEWLDLVQEEIRELLAPTSLRAAPIVPVSAQTGQGLPKLIAALAETLAQSPSRPDLGRPRLPIDRVFSVAGFGTVVTGTLVDGSLRLGDEIVIIPSERRSRIRGLQTHKSKLETAQPGSRVAVNLTGLHPDDIRRGDVLTIDGVLRGSMRVDVRLRALANAPVHLRHNMEITFHHAAAEAAGRLRLLEDDKLVPGAEAWAQIELHQPIALARGDRFIIRRPSPSATLGGGVVVDPAPRRRHRRRRPELFAQFQTLLKGDASDLLENAIDQQGPIISLQALQAVDLPREQSEAALAQLLAAGRAQRLDETDANSPLITPAGWRRISQKLVGLLGAFHAANPLRAGMPREEVKSRLQPNSGWTPRLFNAIVMRAQTKGLVLDTGAVLALPDFEVRFTPIQQRGIDALLAAYRAEPYTPPSVKQSLEIVDETVFNALIEQGILVRVAADVAFERTTYEAMVAAIRNYIREHGQITVADLRDLFGASRKYTLALLEYLDQIRITRREGDVRVLR